MAARRDVFTTIRSEGALLPADFLKRLAEGDGKATEAFRAQLALGEILARAAIPPQTNWTSRERARPARLCDDEACPDIG